MMLDEQQVLLVGGVLGHAEQVRALRAQFFELRDRSGVIRDEFRPFRIASARREYPCLLYTSDAADE